MGTALSIAGDVLVYVASFGFCAAFLAGSVGLVRATSRNARRHGVPKVFRAVMVVVAIVVAFIGGGLVFAFFWPFRQLRATRPSGARRRWLQAAAALSVLLPSGCVAGSVVAGPCSFDPPPGDQLSLTITNDTSAAVTVVDCIDDKACAEAWNPTPVAAGRRASMPLEGCQGGTLGVLAANTGLLQSCIAEPTEDENFTLHPVAISQGHPCPNGRTGARVRIDGPGS